MPITRNANRQQLITAFVDFTFADMPTTANPEPAIELPVGAIVTGGDITVTTAWNTATSAVANIGDVTSATRLGSAVDLKVAARTVLTAAGLGFTYTNTERFIRLVPTYVGAAATAGAARLTVTYYVKGRGEFSHG